MFENDLKDSSYDFIRVVWPAIKDKLQGGELVPLEARMDSELAKTLDMYSGIDAWQFIEDKKIVRGVASRIQWVEFRPWDTFTIRYSRDNGVKTEYEKRIKAINGEDGAIYPYLTVQAYVELPKREGDLLSVCCVKTDDLFRFAEDFAENHANNGCYFKKATNATFLVVPWQNLLAHKISLKQARRI